MKAIIHIVRLLTAMLLMTSCADDIIEVPATPSDDGKGIGQMVMFSSGTTENSVVRAKANTYYMPDAYRFVCRMYYKAQTGSEKFDVSGRTDQTAWLKVGGNIGNSLYWNSAYSPVKTSIKGQGGVDEYGNDYGATAFYWQNRKEHAFLAWTDLNKAVSMTGGSKQGSLKFDKDMDYRVYSNETVLNWELDYYEIYGVAETFKNQEAMEEYVRNHGNDHAFKAAQTKFETENRLTWSPELYHYRHGKQYKYSSENAHISYPDTKTYDLRWYQEFMYFKTIEYSPDGKEEKEMSQEQGKSHIVAYLKKDGVRVAKAELVVDAEGRPLDSEYNVTDDPERYTYTYAQTDADGNLTYDENYPEFTFYYGRHYVQKEGKKFDDYPCNKFDLTRGKKTSMAQQPDIAQALTLQAPSGATQEANRVNLYFRHQFSQIQVNVMNAADNSVTLRPEDIVKVELLGVSEEGYVFTDLDEDGNVHAAAYKEIDFSKYSEADLKDNPYGTSFDMFPMAQVAPNYLRSFNCITFGQLQAIRITWKEQDSDGYEHAATFRIPDTKLVNLQSGMRYIWNIEVRRGTLAIIRTEIVDWELPKDEPHNGSADGTIQN